MNDKQRYEKMKHAQELIREVQLSYEKGSENRRMLNRFIVHSFSNIGSLFNYLIDLNTKSDEYDTEQRKTDQELLEALGIK